MCGWCNCCPYGASQRTGAASGTHRRSQDLGLHIIIRVDARHVQAQGPVRVLRRHVQQDLDVLPPLQLGRVVVGVIVGLLAGAAAALASQDVLPVLGLRWSIKVRTSWEGRKSAYDQSGGRRSMKIT